jgi:hypothetical protein
MEWLTGDAARGTGPLTGAAMFQELILTRIAPRASQKSVVMSVDGGN